MAIKLHERTSEDQLTRPTLIGLISVTLVIAFLVAVFIAVLMVAVSAVLVFRAAHAKRLLDGHLLPAKLHGVHQVVDDSHGPHGRGVPGLHVAVFPHKQHGEVFRADLEIVPHVLHQGGGEPFTLHCSTAWTEETSNGELDGKKKKSGIGSQIQSHP